MQIQDHWLVGKNVYKYRSTNFSEDFDSEVFKPDTIVMHYTAGSTVEGAVCHLCDAEKEVSSHLVVSRDLRIFQLVPFNIPAWHSGVSEWKNRTSLNQYSIGIEIDNAGKLDFIKGKYLSWFEKEYPENEVIKLKHVNREEEEYWHKYNKEQILLLEEISKILIKKYGIKDLVGHDEISPYRKIDPGPAFPIKDFKKLICI